MNQENASLLVPNGSYVDPMEDILISPAGNSIVSITLEQRRVKSLGDFYPGHGIVNHSSPVLQNTSPVIKLRLFCKFSLFLAWTMLEEHCQFFFYWAILSVIQIILLCPHITIWLGFCLLDIYCIPVLPLWDPDHLVWNWGSCKSSGHILTDSELFTHLKF